MTELEVRQPGPVAARARAVAVRAQVARVGRERLAWVGRAPQWARFVAGAALLGLMLAPGWRPWSGEWFVWSELTASAWHRPGADGAVLRLVVAPAVALLVAGLGVAAWRRR